MKKLLSRILYCVAIFLSYLMCIVVAYKYKGCLCSIQYEWASAPAWVAFLWLLLFLPLIGVALFFWIKFWEKAKLEAKSKEEKNKTVENKNVENLL